MPSSQNNSPILIDDFDYNLPDERIAKYPLQERDRSKLLIYRDAEISEDIFLNAVNHLPEKALLVYNNTRVIHARLMFQKITGAQIEVFCLEPVSPADYALSLGANHSCIWKCMIGNRKKWKEEILAKTIFVGGNSCNVTAQLLSSDGNTYHVEFCWDNAQVCFADILDKAGELPIPPYLHRKTEESDKTSYQTVYSKIDGSVAAPTAGLHFTKQVLESLKEKQIETEELTLHVGAGTFQPVKTADIADHQMHAEVISVQKTTIQQLIDYSNRIIAVGTTSVRTLESLYYIGVRLLEGETDDALHIGQWEPYEREYNIDVTDALKAIVKFLDENGRSSIHAHTSIMIRPGFQFRLICGMFTNFHQPKSTLLLLISALTGKDWKRIYDYAMTHDFRFLSYGDSSLLMKKV